MSMLLDQMPKRIMKWQDAEHMLRNGVASSFRQFSLKKIALLVSSSFTITENMNKIYVLARRPWTPKIRAIDLSFLYPIYICVDGGQYNLKMDRGVVTKTGRPNTGLELNYFGFIQRISKPLSDNEKSLDWYPGPYTDVNIKMRLEKFYTLRKTFELDNVTESTTVEANENKN